MNIKINQLTKTFSMKGNNFRKGWNDVTVEQWCHFIEKLESFQTVLYTED